MECSSQASAARRAGGGLMGCQEIKERGVPLNLAKAAEDLQGRI